MTIKYNNKIPARVRSAMEEFTSNNCFLVRNKRDLPPYSRLAGNCHANVENHVDNFGGSRLSGWLLQRTPELIRHGIWMWAFHSVWKSPEGVVFDVTDDELYKGAEYKTVWLDAHRDPNLVEGLNFNNVIVFEKSDAARSLSSDFRTQIDVGVLYWTTPKMDIILPINSHSGIYRWLNSQFPKNIELFEKTYDCRLEGARFVPNSSGSNTISSRALFDYGIGR